MMMSENEPVAELIAMLDAAVPTDQGAIFDHTPEEIGLHVMENVWVILAALRSPAREEVSGEEVERVMRAYMRRAGVPDTEFDPSFAVRMMQAMMVSYHKYGRVSDAYPLKFDAASDVRARMGRYRQTGNKHYLVDAANFTMIEAMHPGRKNGAEWGGNDAADSPGRTTASGHRLVQEDNSGNRILGIER